VALLDMPVFRAFARLDDGVARLPDETTSLRFRHLLEKHDLATDRPRVVDDILQAKGLMMRKGTVVDATLIAAFNCTKNATGERHPEMEQSKKGNQWSFGMKAHIGVDVKSGLVHSVVGTAASIRAKVEHPFRVLQRQFGYTKIRCRGWPRTRRRSSRCSPCPTCGWRAGG
jgi:IS5 family transposase